MSARNLFSQSPRFSAGRGAVGKVPPGVAAMAQRWRGRLLPASRGATRTTELPLAHNRHTGKRNWLSLCEKTDAPLIGSQAVTHPDATGA